MSNFGKWLLGLAAVGTGLVLVKKGNDVSQLQKEFTLDISGRIHAINGLILTLAIDIIFKNPTAGRINVRHPNVALYENQIKLKANEPFVQSIVEDKKYQIQPYAETKFDPIFIRISLLSLNSLTTVYKVIKGLLNGQQTKLVVRASTFINGTYKFAKVEEITI